MGFLDEVKKQQAAEKTGTEAQAVQPVDAALPSSTSAVADCLKMLNDGLGAFARRLGAAMPDIRASYEISGYGRIEGLRQSGYKLTKVGEHQRRFEFQCNGRESIEFSTSSRECCDETLDKLITAGLQVQYRNHADWKFLFTVKPIVPVEITFEPHRTGDSVRLTAKNLDEIGIRVEKLEPARIDESFLHQLEQCVLRKPNNFTALLGNQIPDDLREKFRSQIAERQQERENDSQVAESDESGAINRLKGLLGRFAAKKS